MELVDLLSGAGIELLGVLGEEMKVRYSGEDVPGDEDGLLVLVKLPRKRRAGGPVEDVEYFAFAMWPIREASIATGHLAASGPRDPLAPLVVQQFERARACAVGVQVLRTAPALTRRAAKFFCGLDRDLGDPKVALIGAGALGSQVHGHLARMGWGRLVGHRP